MSLNIYVGKSKEELYFFRKETIAKDVEKILLNLMRAEGEPTFDILGFRIGGFYRRELLEEALDAAADYVWLVDRTDNTYGKKIRGTKMYVFFGKLYSLKYNESHLIRVKSFPGQDNDYENLGKWMKANK